MAKKKTATQTKTRLDRVIELTVQLQDIYAQVKAGTLPEFEASDKIAALNATADAEDLPFRAAPNSVNPWGRHIDTYFPEEESSSDF